MASSLLRSSIGTTLKNWRCTKLTMASDWRPKRTTGTSSIGSSRRRIIPLTRMTSTLSFIALQDQLTTSSRRFIRSRQVKSKFHPSFHRIIDTQQEDDDQVPDYAKPTIAHKAKDHQIDRIVDKDRKTFHAQAMITHHNEMLRSDRLNPGRYTKRPIRQGPNEQASAQAMSQLARSKKNAQTSRFMNEEEAAEQMASG